MSFDFGRSDEDGVGSFDDFMKSITPAYNGLVGGSTSAAGVALSGFGGAGLQFAAGDPVGGSLKALQTAVSLIGRGRREADEITAVQTPVSQLLEQVNQEMGVPSITAQRLIQLRQVVVAAGGQLQEVLARPWPDGRAAAQGTQTMFGNPGYLRVTVENIDKMLAARGVGGGANAEASPAAAGDNSGILLAGAAALAYAFFG